MNHILVYTHVQLNNVVIRFDSTSLMDYNFLSSSVVSIRVTQVSGYTRMYGCTDKRIIDMQSMENI